MINPTVVFPEPRTVTVEDRPVPAAAPGEVVVRSRRSLISPGTELTILAHAFEDGSAWASYGVFPFEPGYSTVGVIASVGEGCDHGLVGRRVAAGTRHSLFSAVPLGSVRFVPDAVTDDSATLFTLAETAMNGVRRSRTAWGESVVVFGAGLVGQLAARFAGLAGAEHVFVVDLERRRLDLLPNRPPFVVVDPNTEDLQSVIAARGSGPVDVVIEVTGNPTVIPSELAVIRPQGRFVMLSSPRGGGTLFDFHDLCNAISIEIIGAHVDSSPAVATPAAPWTRARHAELFFRLLADRRIEVDQLITARVPYTVAPDAYDAFLSGSSSDLGVVLEWPEEEA